VRSFGLGADHGVTRVPNRLLECRGERSAASDNALFDTLEQASARRDSCGSGSASAARNHFPGTSSRGPQSISRVETAAVYGAGMDLFTVAEAQRVLDDLRPTLSELVTVRADAVELSATVNASQPSPLGGLPELKAAEARLDELMTTIQQTGVELKGFAPLLLDFPAVLDGVPVLLCWLEGDGPIAWYHRTELGFAGRRPLPDEATERNNGS
jgi:hypothetical protein